ncbi:MAG: cupin domain-containing protein [Deltaproteobacteria bacterium]|nr:cupin domain-containing protein [Deltaproteobacteria bacterium]
MKIIRAAEIEIQPASHEDSQAPAVIKKVMLARDDLQEGSVQMINWSTLLSEKTFRKHYHDNMEEVFIIVKGRARIMVDDEEAEISDGDIVVIPAKSVHTMENLGQDNMDFISLGIAPGKRGRTIVL